MSFKLRKTIPEINADIYQWEYNHGKSKLFENILFFSVKQNRRLEDVQIVPLQKYIDIKQNIQELAIQYYGVPETLIGCDWVLRSLSAIRFTRLTYLMIQNLQIDSIQCFGWLQAPNLEGVNFTNNNIVSLKPLAKGSFPKLQERDFSLNPVFEFPFIYRYDMIMRQHFDFQQEGFSPMISWLRDKRMILNWSH